MDFIASDSEDNSELLEREGRSGFEKQVTQIAALGPGSKRFRLVPNIKRRIIRNGISEYEMDIQPYLSHLSSQGAVSCYFHNLGYDLGNIFPRSLDRFNITMVGNRIISAKWRDINFRDSFNIWPMSLKKIGEAIGIKKKEMDVHDPAYVFQDCRILAGAVQLAGRFCAEYGVDLKATLGSQSILIWKAMGGSNWFCNSEFAKAAYFGGRVEIFKTGGVGEFLYTDINSLYPHCMTKPYPTGYHEWLGVGRDKAMALIKGMKPCWGVARIWIEVPRCQIVPLPVRREDGSIYYPYGSIKGTYMLTEIFNAMRHGAKLLEVYECYGSDEAYPYYKDFVLEMYKKRKLEKDEGTKLFLKLLMNNLYGQLGMSGLVTRSLERDNHPDREGTIYGNKILAEIQMPLPEHANYLHAAQVTSYARVEIQNYLRQVPACDLLYCDTDSIMFFAPKFKSPFRISNELGEMKLESEMVAVNVDGPKFYDLTKKTRYADGTGRLQKVYKSKGIPNRVILSDKDRFKVIEKKLKSKSKNIVTEGQKELETIKTLPQVFHEKGKVDYRLPYRFRESVAFFDRRDKPDGKLLGIWRTVEKEKRSEYDKKKLCSDGKTFTPLKHESV